VGRVALRGSLLEHLSVRFFSFFSMGGLDV
jgi:hypothetical protein